VIVHYCEQRTPEWDLIRAGKITASVASKLVTPTGKISTQYKKEIGRIVAERMGLQVPNEVVPSYWMQRGISMEPEGVAAFEIMTDETVEHVGFVESDDNLAGFSPDGLVGVGKYAIPFELKCPMPSTHIGWLMAGVLPPEHKAQVHFAMAITGASYAYFMSYTPEVEPLILMVEADDYTVLMAEQIKAFGEELQTTYKSITGKDYANN
jgi:hypothetical protein